MAKILNKINKTPEMIDEIIEQRINDDYKSYSRFLENAPIYVTYYKQNIVESTTDVGFGNVYGNSSADSSAKRYNKIKKLPIYNVDKSNFNLDIVDGRLKGEFESKGVIPPNVIEPIPEDYFLIHYMHRDMLFKVTNISIDNIKSNNFYEIEFKYCGKIDINHLEDDVVKNFTCVFENIGSEDNCLLEDDLLKQIKQLSEIYENISEQYLDNFFFQKADAFIFNFKEGYKLYDPYLTKFISDNRLFERSDHYNSIHIYELVKPHIGFEKKYRETIFKYIEKRKPLDKFIKKFRTLRIYDINTYFGNSPLDFCQIELYDKRVDVLEIFKYDYIHFTLIKDLPPVGYGCIHGIQDFGNHFKGSYVEDNIGLKTINCDCELFTGYKDESGIDCEVDLIPKVFDFETIDCEVNWRYPYKPQPMLEAFPENDFDDTIELFEDLIRLYMTTDNDICVIDYIVEKLNDILIDDRLSYFVYTPIVLYIINNIIDNNKIK